MSAPAVEVLRERLAAGTVLVVVGSGVSAAATGGNPLCSWRGLVLDGQRWAEAAGHPVRGGPAMKGMPDADTVAALADRVTDALGGETGREFADWLGASVGSLRATDSSVLDALVALDAPLATTNYDSLIEQAAGLPGVTWQDGVEFERALLHEAPAVSHLYGSWESPPSVLLAVGPTAWAADKMAHVVDKLTTLLFVGFDDADSDPRLAALRATLAQIPQSERHVHYRLCLDDDVKRFSDDAEHVVALGYGDRRDELAGFLRGLAPDTRDAGGDAHGKGDADDHDRIDWVSDARASIDLLQRKPLAQALGLRLRRLHEAEPGRSFLIHVDGRWGSGKTTLLDLLRSDLAAGWLVVDFDAWRQMRVGPPWWALLASLRHAVRRDLGPIAAARLRGAEAKERVRRGGALYGIAVAALLALVVGLVVLLGGGLDLGAASKVTTSLLGVVTGIGALYAATRAVGGFLLWDSAAGARVFEQSHRDPMESVARHFAWLIARAGRPVVFFVDDLDRCENEYVVAVLDSIQTLVRDAPHDGDVSRPAGCYVIVAADGRWIRKAYECAHDTFADAVAEPGRPLGYMFLNKIFQLTVPVPAMSPQRQELYLQALLRVHQNGARGADLAEQVDVLTERVKASTNEEQTLKVLSDAPTEVRAEVAEKVVEKLAEKQIQDVTAHQLERFAALLEPNPRAMKLVLNAYGIARTLQVIEDNVVPGDALALWTILRVRWPALTDYVRQRPEAIVALAECKPPAGAPADLADLFEAPDVVSVVRCEKGGPLSAAMIRACCGMPEPAPLVAAHEAGAA
jgi:hypothetical protein